MAYTGLLRRKAPCAICKKQMPKGELVYFDSTKNQGSHLVHKQCWDDLRASRPRQKASKSVKPVLSSEELDPPF